MRRAHTDHSYQTSPGLANFRAGIRQFEIARRARVSQSVVSGVIRRTVSLTEATERVWVEIERALVERGQQAS